MLKKNIPLFFLILLTISVANAQNKNYINEQTELAGDSIYYTQIITDTIFDSRQIISLLIVPNKALNRFNIEFGYSQTELSTTSSFAKSNNALAAVNGGFFNMDDGGSVTYFEINDTVINKSRDPELKWGITDSIINGAIVLTYDNHIIIEPCRSEQFYESSKKELAVLLTGPVLLKNSKETIFPDMKFVKNRHPRTCLCKTEEALVCITIDGRTKEAEGMSLYELQKFLKEIGCIDAINLDGGGSTTMWIRNREVVNHPSGKEERKVANVLMILDKN
ncbi:phosphodiester glycosidase family protein [Prolixibacteraceae bacterium Z1-6]|uniref:Phosphodiester glycosidase family protein n=1 Tax=Draconibacterium aestuarii TaxID=2998507 RepID=A0A9X3FA57_9BACT|nr:phosphodiester glycosidase family protein [Prolixibacteraceae bacterium Z1-6]